MKNNFNIIKDEKNKKIIAIAKLGNQYFRGVAKCNPIDTYDEKLGTQLAIARCKVKLTKKRKQVAEKQLVDAYNMYQRVSKILSERKDFFGKCTDEFSEAIVDCALIESDLKTNK